MAGREALRRGDAVPAHHPSALTLRHAEPVGLAGPFIVARADKPGN